MKIIWHGHACFTLEFLKESMVLDPYEKGSVPGLSMPTLEANHVLMSHDHADHHGIENIKIISQPMEAKVTKINTYHDDQQGKLRGINIIHIIEEEELRLVHLGDLGCPLTHQQIELLSGCDVLMIPVGGHYTIDAMQAYQIVQQLHPRIVIPMHYYGETFGYDVLAPVDDFIQYCKDCVFYESNELFIDTKTASQTVILKCPKKD